MGIFMTPMGALAVSTYGLLGLSVAGLLALFLVKKAATARVIFLLMAGYCVLNGFIAYTAQPSNYAGAQLIAVMAALLAVAAVVLRFLVKRSVFLAKLLLCGSLLVSLALMF